MRPLDPEEIRYQEMLKASREGMATRMDRLCVRCLSPLLNKKYRPVGYCSEGCYQAVQEDIKKLAYERDAVKRQEQKKKDYFKKKKSSCGNGNKSVSMEDRIKKMNDEWSKRENDEEKRRIRNRRNAFHIETQHTRYGPFYGEMGYGGVVRG